MYSALPAAAAATPQLVAILIIGLGVVALGIAILPLVLSRRNQP